ncbi:hypothetical protein NPIL_452501 [Nephila pilipes]|uniref:Uncharacterized protein n=1 Tax=Nephila pilipes TaxID=299642 RepID=A0A8X6PGU0_NEPPI|nr:hypothetical protein NPIL_452501 [Nephila pilipes]
MLILDRETGLEVFNFSYVMNLTGSITSSDKSDEEFYADYFRNIVEDRVSKRRKRSNNKGECNGILKGGDEMFEKQMEKRYQVCYDVGMPKERN